MKYIVDSAGVKFDTTITTVTVGSVASANAGLDTTLCPINTGVTLGGAAASGMSYSWTNSALSFVPQISNPAVAPTTTTSYYLKVSNAAGTCNSYDTVVVNIDIIPTMNIIVSSDTVCFNNQIVVNTSAPGLKNYNFSFGSGAASTGAGSGPYMVSWGQSGLKCITATAKTINAGCPVSSVAMNPCVFVRNCFSPKASFLTPVGPNCSGNSLSFTDASQNSPTSWSWHFISPDTINHPAIPQYSSAQNPVITAPIPGRYYITLFASNSGGISPTYLDSIEVFETPTADFDYIDTICVSHNTIIIYNGNAKTTATYTWSFNPSPTTTTGGNQGPVYANWSSVGTKSVNLQVVENGCPSFVTSKNITVTPLPVAHFIYNNIGPNYSFINQSSGTPNSFFWSFGDGQTSTTQHPIHSYTSNGDFLVTLTVSKNGCSDDDTVTLKAIVNGIDDAIKNNIFNAFHDNSTSTLHINLMDKNLNDFKVELININGQIILSQNYKSEKNITISTLDFSKGMYALKYTDKQGNFAIKKWIKD
jgi:PKD repeat protein